MSHEQDAKDALVIKITKSSLITVIDEIYNDIDPLTTGFNNHTLNYSNPHSVTKAQVGLGNVDNTSDINKPISTATQDALDLKLDIADLDLTSKADISGDTFTGPITVSTGAFSPFINLDANAGVEKTIVVKSGGVDRWSIKLANAESEASGNIGSNIEFVRHDNSGSSIDTPLKIQRSDGTVIIPRLDVDGSTITNVADPVDVTDATNKQWVLGQITLAASGLPTGGILNQVLIKASEVDGDVFWDYPPGGVAIGDTTPTGSQTLWVDTT